MLSRRALLHASLLAVLASLAWIYGAQGVGVFVADPVDSICGLRDPRKLSRPARVDYPRLIESTPEWRKIEREGIDPESAQGHVLRSRARARVLKACDHVRRDTGHDSVWKVIRRRDGKAIPDLTRRVLEHLPETELEGGATHSG